MSTLKLILDEYPFIWQQPKRFKALLMDYFPNEKLLRNLLYACVEEHITQELLKDRLCSRADQYRYAKKIVEAHGCSLDRAQEAVMQWVNALGIDTNDNTSLSREEIMAMNIDELELSVRAFNSLRRAGINTVRDLLEGRPADWMGVRNLTKKTIDEVINKLSELGFDISIEKKDKKRYPGREKCGQLRAIRLKIAKANSILYEPAVCNHEGPCLGTCPVCDAEIKYLDEELKKKKQRGDEIILDGIAADDIRRAQVATPTNDDVMCEIDVPEVDGGIEPLSFGGISELDVSGDWDQ